ncbi:MAG: hypothetical protein ABIS50_19390 [Luteolibacter sp.]|uniref:hypothetical protein n=1 Tax=Luteolibacter sp. TaxID=1962973 RepID=UPI0032641C03
MRKSIVVPLLAAMCCIASAADLTKPLTVPSADKKSSITLQLAEAWKTSPSKDAGITIDLPRSGVNVQIWALSQASVDEAAKQVAELIKGQVSNFKVTETKPINVAAAPGKQITGTGEEADDGDPASADVYLFTVEGKVYMICAHGEGDSSVRSRATLAPVLASVKKVEP